MAANSTSRVEVEITTRAQLDGAQKAHAALLKDIEAAKKSGEGYYHLEQRLKAYEAALNTSSAKALQAAAAKEKQAKAAQEAAAKTGILGNALKGLGGTLQDAQGAFAAAGGGVTGLLSALGSLAASPALAALTVIVGALAAAKSAITEFAEAEREIAKLDAALAQNGLLTAQVRQQYQELAGQMQDTTGIADEEWTGVLTRLTQFGSRPETIGMDVEAVKNLAGLMGGDLQGAAQAYSKALQGNLDMFGRYGIVLGEAGDKTEKLARLQELLAQRGGGQLDASAKTLTGQFSQLKNAVSDVFETFGGMLSRTGLLQGVMYGLTMTARFLTETFGGLVPQLDGLTNKMGSAAQSAAKAEAATKALKEQEEGLKKEAEAAAAALDKQNAAIARTLAGTLALIEAEKRKAAALIDSDTTKTPEEKAAAKQQLSAITERQAEDAKIAALEAQKNAIQDSRQKRGAAFGEAGVERTKAEADVAKSKEIDAANAPEQQARAAFKAQAMKVQEIRRKINSAAEAGGLGGSGLFDELADAQEELKRRERRIAPAREAAQKVRKDAGLTGTTEELEAKAEAARQKEKQLQKERDEAAPKDKEKLDALEQEIETARKVRAKNEESRKIEVGTAVRASEPKADTAPAASGSRPNRPTSAPLPRRASVAPDTSTLVASVDEAGADAAGELGGLHDAYVDGLLTVAEKAVSLQEQMDAVNARLKSVLNS